MLVSYAGSIDGAPGIKRLLLRIGKHDYHLSALRSGHIQCKASSSKLRRQQPCCVTGTRGEEPLLVVNRAYLSDVKMAVKLSDLVLETNIRPCKGRPPHFRPCKGRPPHFNLRAPRFVFYTV